MGSPHPHPLGWGICSEGPVLPSSKYLLDPKKTRPPLLYSIVAVQTDPLLPSLSFLLLGVVASLQNLPGKGTYVSLCSYMCRLQNIHAKLARELCYCILLWGRPGRPSALLQMFTLGVMGQFPSFIRSLLEYFFWSSPLCLVHHPFFSKGHHSLPLGHRLTISVAEWIPIGSS